MHKWDRHLQPPHTVAQPVQWSHALSSSEQQTLRSSAFRRSSHGLYVRSGVDPTSAQRVIEAHAVIHGFGALAGWAAAHWSGAPFHDGARLGVPSPEAVQVVVGSDRNIRRRPGIEVSRERLVSNDVADIRGLSCTSPIRTAFDLARLAPSLATATASIDVLLACGLISSGDVGSILSGRTRYRGIQQARDAVGLARSDVRSPYETYLRLAWEVDAALPALLVNQPVFDGGGHLLGIADLLDPTAALVLEYDGADHELPTARKADAARDARMAALGLRVLRFTKLDIHGSRAELVKRFNEARRGRLQARGFRHWTLAPPPGWTPPG